ncbi:MAG: hypothetical protein NZ518_08630 [Dehalococcoidia bacterium]|nr:hypothetical protein [Dehalococcoidia bacterium]
MREPYRVQTWAAAAYAERETLSGARLLDAAELFGSRVTGLPTERPVSVTATQAVASRLGVRRGDAVRVIGAADSRILAALPHVAGRGVASPEERADLILFWPSSREHLQQELVKLAPTIGTNQHIWVIVTRPGVAGCPGAPISQRELLQAGRAVGLIDTRTAFLSECEYGYRFSRRPTIVH